MPCENVNLPKRAGGRRLNSGRVRKKSTRSPSVVAEGHENRQGDYYPRDLSSAIWIPPSIRSRPQPADLQGGSPDRQATTRQFCYRTLDGPACEMDALRCTVPSIWRRPHSGSILPTPSISKNWQDTRPTLVGAAGFWRRDFAARANCLDWRSRAKTSG